MPTAFVLSRLDSLGPVHAVLQALQEQSVRPGLLGGTSAGAVNAAYLAGPGVRVFVLPSGVAYALDLPPCGALAGALHTLPPRRGVVRPLSR